MFQTMSLLLLFVRFGFSWMILTNLRLQLQWGGHSYRVRVWYSLNSSSFGHCSCVLVTQQGSCELQCVEIGNVTLTIRIVYTAVRNSEWRVWSVAQRIECGHDCLGTGDFLFSPPWPTARYPMLLLNCMILSMYLLTGHMCRDHCLSVNYAMLVYSVTVHNRFHWHMLLRFALM